MEFIHQFGYVTQAEKGFVKKEVIGTINHSYFLELSAAVEILNKHLYNSDLFKIFEQNVQEFSNYVTSIIETQFAEHSASLLPEMEFTCNRLYINILSSFRTYLDYSEKFIKNIYGNESVEYSKFKCLTHNIYDANFEYRFIYELRNYAQHCALPINGIGFKISADELFKPFSCELILEFIPRKLLDDYKKWGKIKPELESISEQRVYLPKENRFQNMSVLSITKKFLDCMYSIRDGFQEITTVDITEPGKLLYDFVIASRINDFDVAIFSNIDGQDIEKAWSELPIGKFLKRFTIKIEEIAKPEL